MTIRYKLGSVAHCKMTAAGVALISLALAGQPAAQVPYTETRVSPSVATEATVEVGTPLVTAVTGIVRPTERLILKADASGRGAGASLTVKAGALLRGKETAKGVFYDADPASVQLATFGLKQPEIPAGVFVPNDPAKPATLWWGGTFGASEIKASQVIQFEKVSSNEMSPLAQFRRELVYSGLGNGSLNVLYREYRENMARPAFSQELSYDLSAGSEIGFRGARIRVLKATNVDVTYVVTKGFDN